MAYKKKGKQDTITDELKEAFDLFDQEKIGSINFQEMKVIMRSLGFNLQKNEVADILKDQVREGGEGRLTYPQFVEIMAQKIQQGDDNNYEVERAFKLFDSDGQGRIGVKNLKKIASELGENMSDMDIQQMIEAFDKNKDGFIDFKEFELIMKSKNNY